MIFFHIRHIFFRPFFFSYDGSEVLKKRPLQDIPGFIGYPKEASRVVGQRRAEKNAFDVEELVKASSGRHVPPQVTRRALQSAPAGCHTRGWFRRWPGASAPSPIAATALSASGIAPHSEDPHRSGTRQITATKLFPQKQLPTLQST